MGTINNLLLDEHPLLVMPTLATLIGLNESIVLQQVHYWLKTKEKTEQDYIDGHYWVYNSYERWQKQFPFFSLRTLRRVFTSLEKKGLLISGNYNKAGFDKTKWYTIDYDTYDHILSLSVQNGRIMRPDYHNGKGQNDQTNTKDYTENTPKTIGSFNGATLERRPDGQAYTPFSWSILEKQIAKSCRKHGIQDCDEYTKIIEYYYLTYMKAFREEHPRLSAPAMDRVIEALICGSENAPDVDLDTYKAMIDQHFKTQYDNCDYNICHFMTEGIRNNRFYEACY